MMVLDVDAIVMFGFRGGIDGRWAPWGYRGFMGA